MKARIKGKRARAKAGARKESREAVYMNGNGHANGAVQRGSEIQEHEDHEDDSPGLDPKLWHLEASDEDSTITSDSETML